MNLKDEISNILRGEVSDDPSVLASNSHDASLFEITPRLVVKPKDTDDLRLLVKYVNEHKNDGLSITARSAGTDMSGGSIGNSIVVDFSEHFSGIKEVGDGYAVSQPGVYYRDFDIATLAKGQILPSFPASREICTVGGMVANNSGGEKSLRYGKTENFVQELKVVLADGNEYSLGPIAKAELDRKMTKLDFEGYVYRETFSLIEKNFEKLMRAKPDVSKNSAGYNLWSVWDRTTFDLSKLFVGSQGTLGLISEIRFGLVKPETHSKLIVIFLRSLEHLPEIINDVLAHDPESFESYDDHTLKFAIRYSSDIMKQMGTDAFGFALKFLPEAWLTLTSGFPKQVLLAEFTGKSETEVDEKIAAVQKMLKPLRLASRVTKTEEEAKKYWIIRHESFNLLRKHFKSLQTAPFIDDFCVKPSQLPRFLPQLYAILDRYKLMLTVVGHMGDANFHIIPLMDLSDPKTPGVIDSLSKEVYELVFSYGGSMTGEHNDGMIRGPYLKQMFGEDVFGIFQQVKKIFDPDNIFNPHKKTDSDFGFAMSHLKKS